jgi:hypothetical protein
MRCLGAFLNLAALALLPAAAAADEGCGPNLGAAACYGAADRCGHCGHRAECQRKVCQLVCGTEKVVKHTWAVECEEFCPLLPGHGPRTGDCCQQCGDGCGGGCCGHCGDGCKAPPPPRCGHSKCVKRLVKKEQVVEAPKYKCVVKYLCDGCSAAEAAPPPVPVKSPTAPAPPVPARPAAPAPARSALGVAPLPPI